MAGWRIELHENMPGMLWKKFAYIAGSAAVCAAANCVYEEMRTIPITRALIEQAIEEALAVGRASGAPIMDDSLEWAMNSLDRFPAQGRASMAKDFTEGRPVELEGLNGALIRLAQPDRHADPGQRLPVRCPASAGRPHRAGAWWGVRHLSDAQMRQRAEQCSI